MESKRRCFFPPTLQSGRPHPSAPPHPLHPWHSSTDVRVVPGQTCWGRGQIHTSKALVPSNSPFLFSIYRSPTTPQLPSPSLSIFGAVKEREGFHSIDFRQKGEWELGFSCANFTPSPSTRAHTTAFCREFVLQPPWLVPRNLLEEFGYPFCSGLSPSERPFQPKLWLLTNGRI